MTTPEIKQMAERFLSWKLPDDFNPDGGISFTPIINHASGEPYAHGPTGTNLLTYTQAVAMVQHIVGTLAVVDDERPMTEQEQATIDAAWERHKAAKPVESAGQSAAAERIAKLEADNAKLREALDPSGDTKAAYMGEFHFHVPALDENGEEVMAKYYVPWDVVKQIMAAIKARAALGGTDAS